MAVRMDGSGGQIPLSRVIFNKWDANGDGAIDAQELHALCYHFGVYLDDEQLRLGLEVLDADGSGSIDYDEFVAWWSSNERFAVLQLEDGALQARARASEVFHRFDADRSGFIDRAEFPALFAELESCGLAEGAAEECLRAMDANQDDRVTFNEYVAWVQARTAELMGDLPAAAAAAGGVALPGLAE